MVPFSKVILDSDVELLEGSWRIFEIKRLHGVFKPFGSLRACIHVTNGIFTSSDIEYSRIN